MSTRENYRPTEHNERRIPSPRISNRRVWINRERGEAYYIRPDWAPRHPDAAYSIPCRSRRGWRLDVILLVAIVLAVILLVSLI